MTGTLTRAEPCLFSSDRFFAIFSYALSHGLLLLRSGKTDAAPTRVDILFQDVRAMEIRAWFSGIEIREASPEILKNFASNPLPLLEPGNKMYQVSGGDWSGYILAGIMSTHEDDGGLFEPSALVGEGLA